MSNWPDPTPDESEPPRWGRVVALAALGAFVVWALLSAGELDTVVQSWRPPDVALRGRSEPAPSPAPQISDTAAVLSPDFFTPDFDGAITRPVPFKDCLALIFDTGRAMGLEPVIAEQSADRAIARLPRQNGGVTITCSASDGTMTIEQSGAAGEP